MTALLSHATPREARAAAPTAAILRPSGGGFIAFERAGDAIGHPTRVVVEREGGL